MLLGLHRLRVSGTLSGTSSSTQHLLLLTCTSTKALLTTSPYSTLLPCRRQMVDVQRAAMMPM
jgi:hypothetical protein